MGRFESHLDLGSYLKERYTEWNVYPPCAGRNPEEDPVLFEVRAQSPVRPAVPAFLANSLLIRTSVPILGAAEVLTAYQDIGPTLPKVGEC